MERELWGTFAVNDHCRLNAFSREVLLFNRLVLPVPADDKERERWRHPNPNKPDDSWEPDRLDRMLRILGSQKLAADAGAPLVWEAPWDANKWQYERSRSKTVEQIARLDVFYTTRLILATGEDLPGVVEAVAAFPTAQECRKELQPSVRRPTDRTAARLLIALASPLLVPGGKEGSDFGPLKAAAELAREPSFREARAKYHQWMREFVAPLQKGRAEEDLGDIEVDEGSFTLANERLRELIAAQRKILGADEQRKRWKTIQYAVTIVGVSANVGLALVNPLALVGVGAQLAGFAGFIAGERAAPPPEPRPLNGASMFLTVERQLDWGERSAPRWRRWFERLPSRS